MLRAFLEPTICLDVLKHPWAPHSAECIISFDAGNLVPKRQYYSGKPFSGKEGNDCGIKCSHNRKVQNVYEVSSTADCHLSLNLRGNPKQHADTLSLVAVGVILNVLPPH